METQPNTIAFYCTVARVKTMADGGVRIELDLPEGNIIQAAALMQCQQDGIVLDVELTPRATYI